MALLLSLETSTDVCSVALHQDGQLINHQIHQVEKSHSSLLPGIAKAIMEERSLSFNDLDAVSVSEGPGSYTGLRIGVTTAKGICYAMRIPLIAVPTLDIYIDTLKDRFKGNFNLCPMMDARRMEVYTKMVTQDQELVWDLQVKILDENSFAAIRETTYLYGNGMPKFRDLTNQENLIFIDDIVPDARNMGAIAFSRYRNQNFEDIAYFEPNYLKEWRTTTPKNQLS